MVGEKGLTSGETWTLGPLPLRKWSNERFYYQWISDVGGLVTLTDNFNQIAYIAPSTGVETTDRLVMWRTCEDGSALQIIVNISIRPGTLPPRDAGQITATYIPEPSGFSVAYSLDSTVTRAWIQASVDGQNWTTSATVYPVTSTNRSGTLSVPVPGSGAQGMVYFRLRTQASTVSASRRPLPFTPPTAPPSIASAGDR